MCNMILKENMNEESEDFQFIVANIALSAANGIFTTESVYKQLQQKNIQTRRSTLESIFEEWAENGIIINNVKEYMVNNYF